MKPRPFTPARSRILLIDDQAETLEVFQSLLEGEGYGNIESTTEPRTALQLFREFQPDLVILDWLMPTRAGSEVLRELCAHMPPDTFLPILVVTGDSSIETRRTALRNGASDFVARPYDGTEILARIRNLLETRHRGLEKAAAAVRQTEDRFAAAFEHAPIGLAMVSPNGGYLKANRALCELVGYSEAELLTHTFEEITHTDTAARDVEHARRMIAGELQSYQAEKRYIHKDGRLVTVLVNVGLVRNGEGHPRYFITQVQDITERERVESATKESRRFLQSTLDALSSHIAILDERGTIVEVNQPWRRFAAENELVKGPRGVGDNYLILCDTAVGPYSEEAPLVAAGIRAVMAGAREEFHLEYPCHSPEVKRWFIVRVTRFAGDGPVRVVVAHENVTERKEAELQIERLNADLERRVAERTEDLLAATLAAKRADHAKSVFLSRVSHELRTPLNAILGFGQLLETEHTLGAEPRESVEQMLAASRRLLTLVNEVLDLSSAESGQLISAVEPVLIGPLIEEAMGLAHQPSDPLRVRVVSEVLPECAFQVLANPGRLKQVLLNLLSNAVKYNRLNGTVAVSCVALKRKVPPALRIEVQDTGLGISTENLRRLFKPFDRLDADRKRKQIPGTGVGLTLAKALVEVMGGSLGVESTVGEGSLFWVELPLAGTASSTAVEAFSAEC